MQKEKNSGVKYRLQVCRKQGRERSGTGIRETTYSPGKLGMELLKMEEAFSRGLTIFGGGM